MTHYMIKATCDTPGVEYLTDPEPIEDLPKDPKEVEEMIDDFVHEMIAPEGMIVHCDEDGNPIEDED